MPLLDLVIPGLDVNDPYKCLTSCLFIIKAFSAIGPVTDLTRADLPKGSAPAVNGSHAANGVNGSHMQIDRAEEPELSQEEEDDLLRQSTAGFPDFLTRFFKAVFTLFDNLPEPGKGGRTGGKIEDQMITSLIAACDTVLSALAPDLFDLALRLFVEQIANSPRSNSAKAIGNVASCFARADSEKTLALVLPLCDRQIRAELNAGACSIPSSSTSSPMDGDNVFQFYCYLLAGALSQSSTGLIVHQDLLIDLMRFMASKCLSERGYNHLSRVLANLLVYPCSVWTRDSHFVNADQWSDPSKRKLSATSNDLKSHLPS